MNLLLSRTQTNASAISLMPLRIGGTVTFNIHAELELDDEEVALLHKYNFSHSTLIQSPFLVDLADASKPARFLTIVLVLLLFQFLPISTFGYGMEAMVTWVISIVAIGTVSFVVLTAIYYFNMRTYVSVDQLTNGGRTFHCHCILDIDRLEADIKEWCRGLYVTLEKAKNWGDREINPLPDGEPYYLTDPQGKERSVVLDRSVKKAAGLFKKLGDLMHDDPKPDAASPYQETTNFDPSKPAYSDWKRTEDPAKPAPKSFTDIPPRDRSKPMKSAPEQTRADAGSPSKPASTSAPPTSDQVEPKAPQAPHPFAPKPPDGNGPKE